MRSTPTETGKPQDGKNMPQPRTEQIKPDGDGVKRDAENKQKEDRKNK